MQVSWKNFAKEGSRAWSKSPVCPCLQVVTDTRSAGKARLSSHRKPATDANKVLSGYLKP